MKSGYKILWTNHALFELSFTIKHLEDNWTAKELKNFSTKLDNLIQLISKNPKLFPKSLEKKNIRKAVVDRNNSLYYRISADTVQIISLFSSRQNPENKKI